MQTETKNRILRNLLTVINNIPVINNCQQALAIKTLSRAQLAMISHHGLSFNASCTPLGLITKIYKDLFLALRAIRKNGFLIKNYEEMTS
jgi:hypothetical protein